MSLVILMMRSFLVLGEQIQTESYVAKQLREPSVARRMLCLTKMMDNTSKISLHSPVLLKVSNLHLACHILVVNFKA
jgi:hypothetical protein